MLSNLGGGRRRLRRMKIREAAQLLTEEEAGRLVNDDELKSRALANAEQNGIVFLDEIDKITSRGDVGGPDVSRQGVQRDLLPLVEGTTASTRYGMEKTENIGARRLYTVLEKLLEEVSFDAGKRGPGAVTIDAAYVDARLSELAKNEDLARYVL